MTRVSKLGTQRRVHVVGVGGAGMSAIASVLAAMGHRVSGSDLKASPATRRLASAGVIVSLGHDPSNLGDAELVTVSSAIPESNVEVLEARARGLEVLSRAQMLAEICALRRVVAVSGTHGKTTTTSMLALILVEAGMRPSFLIGGDLNEIGTNAVWDSGHWLVVEADESDGTFNLLDPEIAVVTNVEPDHLDHYGSFDRLVEAFDVFLTERPGGIVAGSDDRVGLELGMRHGGDLVGSSPLSTHRIENQNQGPGGVSFDLRHGGEILGHISLPVIGAGMVSNAAVATVAACRVGAPFDASSRALARFAGVARRFERRGETRGVRFVDDYAHLPTEVRAVISAARVLKGDRLVVVFQPHRYSRMASLGTQFSDSFDGADVVVVTDVFPAGEKPLPGVTGRLVVDAVLRAHPDTDVAYVPGRSELVEHLSRLLRPGDVCLTLGAGDLTTLPDEMQMAPTW